MKSLHLLAAIIVVAGCSKDEKKADEKPAEKTTEKETETKE